MSYPPPPQHNMWLAKLYTNVFFSNNDLYIHDVGDKIQMYIYINP